MPKFRRGFTLSGGWRPRLAFGSFVRFALGRHGVALVQPAAQIDLAAPRAAKRRGRRLRIDWAATHGTKGLGHEERRRPRSRRRQIYDDFLAAGFAAVSLLPLALDESPPAPAAVAAALLPPSEEAAFLYDSLR